MAKRLNEHLTNDYLGAAQRLRSHQQKRKIVAYVESYDDILFWRSLLSLLEDDTCFFEVMLPSRTSLCKGKKVALMNALGEGLGEYMIACVDADYDYMMQGSNEVSHTVCKNPYVFHTYVYAIENFQCYAPCLHNVCVMATLNDRAIFDFESYLAAWSRVVFPLFVWSIWCYRYGYFKTFTMLDLCNVIALTDFRVSNPNESLERLSRKVNVKIGWLQHHLPSARAHYHDVESSILRLGVTRETTYLYLRGHDVFDKVVLPLLNAVCDILRKEREHEIQRLANHETQRENELSGYQHASAPPIEMLRKHTDYHDAPMYHRILDDVSSRLHIGRSYSQQKEGMN